MEPFKPCGCGTDTLWFIISDACCCLVTASQPMKCTCSLAL
jgi:hypothetical protein